MVTPRIVVNFVVESIRTVDIGDQIIYTVTVSNTGTAANAANIVVSDALPVGSTFLARRST
ncbi:DUF11 domain-containing protein [Paenibacillus sp. MWE-103]|uniref:DUF11 domain-containing protein n=1 Tax=Paenibacillus artemisiicola TaxID=1172618 RepID=A0ABS3WBP8_9BACL|nr:DUF11 domain-containing protein [Paenibacillus artemisiicola]MBO7745724.1 DUF11 domain-containing protein [Paenibacillus artemisiicola]